DRDQFFAQRVRQWLAQQQADVGIQFVDVAHRVHAQAVLVGAAAVPESGGALVAGAGGDLRKSVAHCLSKSRSETSQDTAKIPGLAYAAHGHRRWRKPATVTIVPITPTGCKNINIL